MRVPRFLFHPVGQVRGGLVVLGQYVSQATSVSTIDGLTGQGIPIIDAVLDAVLDATRSVLSRHDVAKALASMILSSNLVALVLKAQEWGEMDRTTGEDHIKKWKDKVKNQRSIIVAPFSSGFRSLLIDTCGLWLSLCTAPHLSPPTAG